MTVKNNKNYHTNPTDEKVNHVNRNNKSNKYYKNKQNGKSHQNSSFLRRKYYDHLSHIARSKEVLERQGHSHALSNSIFEIGPLVKGKVGVSTAIYHKEPICHITLQLNSGSKQRIRYFLKKSK